MKILISWSVVTLNTQLLIKKLVNMPGHDHSIAGNMAAGDLNSHEALRLWNCPVINEELDIWHHINEYVLFTFIFSLTLSFKRSFIQC